jgi:hypothetical protein
MANTYNTHLIKLRKSYSIKEISLLFDIDRKTCSRWIKDEDLKVIETGANPMLVLGSDLKEFIQKRRKAKKVPLAQNEYYCLKCHIAVEAKIESESVIKTGKKIGKNGCDQLVKTGICEVCGTKINRFIGLYQKD